MVEWKPTESDLEWTKNLFNSLKDGGIWKFSTGVMGERIGNTNATFRRRGEEMELTDVHIEDMGQSARLMNRIEQAKICFEKLGILRKTTNSVDTMIIDMASGFGIDKK